MSTLAPSVRGKSWVFQVTALCIVLGMLLALSLKTHTEARRIHQPTRLSGMDEDYLSVARDNARLRKDMADLNSRYEKLARAQAKGVHTSDFQRILDQTKAFAGTTTVHGPGIIVVLHDSPKANSSTMNPDVLSQYIVHECDIRDIVTELYTAGAEAVSINGQRLVSNSAIRCSGPIMRVYSNSSVEPPSPISAPFIIKAVGNPQGLNGALTLPGGRADGLNLLDMIEVTKESDIEIPAYSGSIRFSFAH